MPTYYTQTFRYQKGNTVFYGEQTEHNHDKSNEFSKAALDWLVANANWPKAEIETEKFKSGQSKPAAGKELAWNNATKKWVKK